MTYVYVGTLNWGASNARGIYSFVLDDVEGGLSELEVVALPDATFIVASQTRDRLYAVTFTTHFEGEPGAGLVAFAIDPSTGRLSRLNHQIVPSAHASYLSLDRSERFLLVANGFGATASVFPIAADGRVQAISDLVHFEGGPTVGFGEYSSPPFGIAAGASHPHCIRPAPDNRFVVVTDMPRARVLVFAFDAHRGTLSPRSAALSPPDGAPYGARHFEWHPNGRFLYVVNERVNSATAFSFDAQAGALEPIQTVATLPGAFAGENFTADIHLHPSGRFLYLSNRGHDSIAVFAVDGDTGRLEAIAWEPSLGHRPRFLAFTPDARWMLVGNNSSAEIVTFGVDSDTGRLTPTGHVASVPGPSSATFVRQSP
jgi:6-phosphogluconolactonase